VDVAPGCKCMPVQEIPELGVRRINTGGWPGFRRACRRMAISAREARPPRRPSDQQILLHELPELTLLVLPVAFRERLRSGPADGPVEPVGLEAAKGEPRPRTGVGRWACVG
jgi:hypothetical protein